MPSSSGKEGVAHFSPEKERVITTVIFLLSPVESVEVAIADLLDKRRSALLVLGREGVRPWASSSFPQWRVVEVVKAYLLMKKKRSALVVLTKGG